MNDKRSTFGRLSLLALLALFQGCSPAKTRSAESELATPAARFEELESRLLNATAVRVEFHVTAEGAIEADIRGRFEVRRGALARLTGIGHFAGEPVDLSLRANEVEMTLSNGSSQVESVRPAHLNAALLIGLTRMGVLHNLAMLTSTQPPDHAEGGVWEWVTVHTFSEDPTDAATIVFALTVAGEPVGSASIYIDSSGAPVERRQTVQFPSGEMRVVERYTQVVIEE